MTIRFSRALSVFIPVLLLVVAGSAGAQTNAEINAGIQFNFSTPGARSLGLGGAFLGLADDATAAFTNPAGLVVLNRPEVSLEGRSWDYTSDFTVRGHSFGNPTGDGVDTIAGLQSGESSSETSGASFASFVLPKKKWAVAVYRHELANFQSSFRTEGAFVGEGFFGLSRLFPVDAGLDLEIVSFGAAGAYRPTPNLSLGLGVASYNLELDSLTERFDLRPDFFSPPDYSSDNVVNFQTQTGDDDDVAFTVGVLWTASPQWSLGAVYRQGPEFEIATTNNLGDGTVFAEQPAKFNVPDVYGLGIAFRPIQNLTIALDYDQVEYSALTADTINIFREPDDPGGDGQRAAAARLEIDDASEVHLGVEWVMANLKYPLALRFGGWLDPDHKITFRGEPGDDIDAQVAATLFQPGDDEIHYSAGIGLVFGQKFQLDAAVDFSDLVDTASVSGVYRF